MTKIAFIGLGNMGSGMCANLVEKGFDVTAFDLNSEVVNIMVEKGAKGGSSVAEAVADAEVVVTMLPAGKHVHEVYLGAHGVTDHVPPGALFLDCSTISVSEARMVESFASERGFIMMDAPVSGGTAAAEAGTLTFMVGGPDAGFERGKPILEAMGKNIFHAGASGNGQAAKIANNMLLAISMIGTCEAFNLAEKLGLDAQTFYDISSTASGQCWSMTSYCPAPGPVPNAPSNRDYQPGFAVAMMLKDLKLAMEAADSSKAATPLGQHAEELYASLSRAGYDGLDFSGIMQRIKGEI